MTFLNWVPGSGAKHTLLITAGIGKYSETWPSFAGSKPSMEINTQPAIEKKGMPQTIGFPLRRITTITLMSVATLSCSILGTDQKIYEYSPPL